MTHPQLTQEEKDEIFLDLTSAFEQDQITELDFRMGLRRIGFNATDIEDMVKIYRPKPDYLEDL